MVFTICWRRTSIQEPVYPIIHLKGEDIEFALTHSNQYGEDYYTFVNGQFTPQGGTHLAGFSGSACQNHPGFLP